MVHPRRHRLIRTALTACAVCLCAAVPGPRTHAAAATQLTAFMPRPPTIPVPRSISSSTTGLPGPGSPQCMTVSGICAGSALAVWPPFQCSYTRLRARRQVEDCLADAERACPLPARYYGGSLVFTAPRGIEDASWHSCINVPRVDAQAIWSCTRCGPAGQPPPPPPPPPVPQGYTCDNTFPLRCGGTCPPGYSCDGRREPGDFRRTCRCSPDAPNTPPPDITPCGWSGAQPHRQCGGDCGVDQTCMVAQGICGCFDRVPPTYTCRGILWCGGTCPEGTSCGAPGFWSLCRCS